MKQALISPLEHFRIVEISSVKFDVAIPLYWEQCPDEVTTEWSYNSGSFSPPVVPSVPIPNSVTRRQAKQALLLKGYLDYVQPAIDAIPDITQRRLAQLEWDDATEFLRSNPTLNALAIGLGISSAGLDALFTLGNTL